jgi:uncharacterized protein
MINGSDNYDLFALKKSADTAKASTIQLFKSIKKKPQDNLDNIVHQLHSEVFSQINCLSCANCCRSLGPRITDRDIGKLSKHLKIRPSVFIDKYLNLDEDSDYVFKSMPCLFLDRGNYCMVYSERPKACREYPHTDRRRFFQIMDITLKNTFICPAVYAIVEKLKKELGAKR